MERIFCYLQIWTSSLRNKYSPGQEINDAEIIVDGIKQNYKSILSEERSK